MKFLKSLVEQLRAASQSPVEEEPLPTEERRTSVRMDVELKVDLKLGSKVLPATIANITFTGLRLRLSNPLPEGQELTLLREDLGPPFRGTILWCKKSSQGEEYYAGLECELDEEKLINSWLLPALESLGFKPDYAIEQRKLIRIPGKIRCAVAAADGTEFQDIYMLDLSAGGALIECPSELAPDTLLEFKTRPPSLHCAAKVVTSRPAEDGTWRSSLEFTEGHPDDIQAFMTGMLDSPE